MAWLGTWANRRKITIAASDVDADLTNFPVQVRLSTSAGKSSTDVSDIFDILGSNSLRIAFTSDDEVTQLYAEVVYWDSTGEVAEIWVKVPSLLAASGGEIYMYYDNAQTNNTTYVGFVNSTPGANVWDSNFLAVYHLAETTGNYLDSTSNNNDSTGVTVTSRTANGFNNNDSPEVSGSSQDIDLPNPGTHGPDKMIEAFALTDTVASGYDGIVGHRSGSNWWYLGRNAATVHFRWHDSATNRRFDYGSISTGTWYHFCGSLGGTTAKGYLNGDLITTQGSAGVPATTSTVMTIGQGNGDYWDGRIDEVRIHTDERSDAWVAATNDTLRDNFTTWNATETGSWDNGTPNTVTSLGKINGVSAPNIGTVNTV